MNLNAREQAIMGRRNLQFVNGSAKVSSNDRYIVLIEPNYMNVNRQYFSVRVLFKETTGSITICTRARLERALEIADAYGRE